MLTELWSPSFKILARHTNFSIPFHRIIWWESRYFSFDPFLFGHNRTLVNFLRCTKSGAKKDGHSIFEPLDNKTFCSPIWERPMRSKMGSRENWNRLPGHSAYNCRCLSLPFLALSSLPWISPRHFLILLLPKNDISSAFSDMTIVYTQFSFTRRLNIRDWDTNSAPLWILPVFLAL